MAGVTTPSLDVARILAEFSGDARLFPLPSLVIFPDAVVPLKAFEPRYVALVEEALDGDGLVGMALLKPGYQADYEGAPEIHPVICLARILQHKRLSNGHVDFWLYGLARARILTELPNEPFRRATVELLHDELGAKDVEKAAKQVRRALELVPGRRSVVSEVRRLAGQVRGVDAAAGRYADAVATISDLLPHERYELLAEPVVTKRLARLVSRLERRAKHDSPRGIGPKDPSRN
jgi:Lon protease-like protein